MCAYLSTFYNFVDFEVSHSVRCQNTSLITPTECTKLQLCFYRIYNNLCSG